MSGYRVPYGEAESEFTEKRSRFIGHVWRVEDEAEAKARIEETKRRYHDARHNCWCYLLPGEVRYSDDGEPQGTAGQPMLNVFQRREVVHACCVVTRYFGGVLLGAGGLARAYGKAAKDALDAAGTALVTRWTLWEVLCTYALLERLKQEIASAGGRIEGADYGAEITLHAAFPDAPGPGAESKGASSPSGGASPKRVPPPDGPRRVPSPDGSRRVPPSDGAASPHSPAERFAGRLRELSAGTLVTRCTGEAFLPGGRED